MFANIFVLSLFVFCLFSRGQAAPILDDSDLFSISTREFGSSLVIRGLFHQADPVTKKRIDAVSVTSECMMYNIHLQAQQAFITAQHTMIGEKDKVVSNNSKTDGPVIKEYKKRIKNLAKLVKTAGSKVKKHQKALKKLGVLDTECKSLAVNSTSHST